MVSFITRARLTLKYFSYCIARKASKFSKFVKKSFASCVSSKKTGERAPLLLQHAEQADNVPEQQPDPRE
ncbi:uncharacterized protein PG986_006709 [Apiospora aurea]|uniref:Uncharacterized protein n=1 Tax=Apiospora aurea TaxID=335848 RepID=A0ABR1QAH6_9PEZI